MSLTIQRRAARALLRPLFTASSRRTLSSYFDGDDSNDGRQKVALVLGSSGALGKAVTTHLDRNLGMQVLGADIVKLPDDEPGSPLDAFIELPKLQSPASLGDLTVSLVQGISDVLDDGEEIDAIICASGGWMGDPPLPKSDATEEDFLRGAREYGETMHKMLDMNLYPVLAAGYAANRFMADEGTIELLLSLCVVQYHICRAD